MLVDYEQDKLHILHPDAVNVTIILLFFCFIILFARRGKTRAGNVDFLNWSLSVQLRGFAIFFVVLGHLWVHVSWREARLVFSGDAVTLFFILSGFGLTRTLQRKRYTFKTFVTKRIKRVMVPYWIATIIFLVLDYTLLGRWLPLHRVVATLAGLNFRPDVCHIDYVRWFIGFLLFWYVVFYGVFSFVSNRYRIYVLFCIAFILLLYNYYIIPIGWMHFFAFPLGVFLAVHQDAIREFMRRKDSHSVVISATVLLLAVVYRYVLSYKVVYDSVYGYFPNILLALFDELVSLALSTAVIVILLYMLSKIGKSIVLSVLGVLSYEVFLIHGAFLIKYNPVISSVDNVTLVIQFYGFVVFILLLSRILVFLTEKIFSGWERITAAS